MRHAILSAILFAASLSYAFTATAQTGDYAASSTLRCRQSPASDERIHRQVVKPAEQSGKIAAAPFDASFDSQYEGSSEVILAIQFFPSKFSGILPECRSAPVLLLGLLGLGLLGAVGAVVAGRRRPDEKERS